MQDSLFSPWGSSSISMYDSPKRSVSRQNRKIADRFVPIRSVSDCEADLAQYTLNKPHSFAPYYPASSPSKSPSSDSLHRSASEANSSSPALPVVDSPVSSVYTSSLAETLFDVYSPTTRRVLNFSDTPSPIKTNTANQVSPISSPSLSFVGKQARGSPSKRLLDQVQSESSPKTKTKSVSPTIVDTPERVLDAPDLLDDYYLNLLDWSSKNVLAVALSNAVYLWNAETKQVTELMRTESPDNYISSIQFNHDGTQLSVGTNYARVQLWDVQTSVMKRSIRGHVSRVSSLSWRDSNILSSGSRDSSIIHHDLRLPQCRIGTFQGHSQEVCGLKWSSDGQLLASGGNDNTLCIWEGVNSTVNEPKYRLTDHIAAVKALAWCPWKPSVLASGGGTADRTIRFWNSNTGTCLSSVDTGSQVCALRWNQHTRQLISSHGFSLNQICVWKFPSMQKVAELTGHQSRVLHLAMSPDETMIVSAAGDRDQTLRFWRMYDGRPKSLVNLSLTGESSSSASSAPFHRSIASMHIR